jgi:hypothetical protein
MGVAVRRDCEAQSRITGGPCMAIYDRMSPEGRERLMEVLGNLTGLQDGPDGRLPDGTHYEYDPDLRATVEVTPSGERFPVVLVDGRLQGNCEILPARKGEAS